jgi:hypothetical protein
MSRQLLDSIPVLGIFVLFAIITFLCFEIGFRVGRWWQDRMPGEQEGPTDMMVGSLLALMAFVLAITMGMAADRFDTRRGLVLAEANAIGKAYLEADYLPEPQGEELKNLLRTYAPLRIVETGMTPAQVFAAAEASEPLRAAMWAIVGETARSGYLSDLMSSLGESVSDLESVNQSRIVAGVYARVPESIIWLLLIGSALALGMVGYSGGLAKRRSILSAAVLIFALGAVTTLVIDLDRPTDGILTVSQQALKDVQERIGPPTP